jgi:hypothetical protein
LAESAATGRRYKLADQLGSFGSTSKEAQAVGLVSGVGDRSTRGLAGGGGGAPVERLVGDLAVVPDDKVDGVLLNQWEGSRAVRGDIGSDLPVIRRLGEPSSRQPL